MIEVKNLEKFYKNSTGNFQAIKAASLKLGDSGLVFLNGESGAGKSTLLNILAGIDNYDSGTVSYNGNDILSMKQCERDFYRSEVVGIVLEDENLVSYLTVSENISLAKTLKGETLSSKELNETLNKLGILHLKNRKIQELSSGQLQRVLIARILIQNSKVLFLDEPTRRLDEKNSKEFWKIIKKISKKKLVVAVSHDSKIVGEFADRVIEIRDGEITKDRYIDKNLKKKDEKLFALAVKKEKMGITKKVKCSTAIKLGFKSLSSQKGKYITTIIFSCLVLISFAMMYLLGTYDPSVTIAKSVEIQNLPYVTMSKVDDTEFLNSDFANIYNSTKENVLKMYKTNLHLYYGNALVINRGLCNINGFIEEDLQTLVSDKNALGQKILYKVSDANDGITISDYLVALMNKYGVSVKSYKNSSEEITYKNQNTEDFVGMYVKIENEWTKICGIFETDYKDYVNENTLFCEGEEFEYKFESVYSVIHFAKEIISNRYEFYVEPVYNLYVGDLTLSEYGCSYTNSLNTDYCKFIGEGNYINEDEIVVNYNLFNSLYLTNYTYNEIASFSVEDFQNVMGNSNILIKTKYGYEKEFTIVGVSKNDYDIHFSSSDRYGYDAIGLHASLPCLNITYRADDATKLASVIKKLGEIDVDVNGMQIDEINNFANKIASLKTIFVVTTIVVLLFTLYFIAMFFSDTIRKEKYTIGVYRTMGITSKELVGIYFFASILTTVISFVFAVFLSLHLSGVSNLIVAKVISLPFHVFNAGGLVYLWMFLIAIGTALVGSLLPILHYCNKTPKNVVKL